VQVQVQPPAHQKKRLLPGVTLLNGSIRRSASTQILTGIAKAISVCRRTNINGTVPPEVLGALLPPLLIASSRTTRGVMARALAQVCAHMLVEDVRLSLCTVQMRASALL